MEPLFLPETPALPDGVRRRLTSLYERRVLAEPSVQLRELLAEEFDVDIRARYGPFDLAHPIGKASGQLSLQPRQVRADADAGLAFVVLKTVIAEDEGGAASMEAWKIKEPRMEVDRIRGNRVDRPGAAADAPSPCTRCGTHAGSATEKHRRSDDSTRARFARGPGDR